MKKPSWKMGKNKGDDNNYVFLCWLVNVVGAIAFVFDPIYVLVIYLLTIFTVHKLPDILLDPFEISDVILYSIYTFIFCLSILYLHDIFDFSKLKALILCMPIAIAKEIWFYLKCKDIANRK
jgi:hypothetical protein